MSFHLLCLFSWSSPPSAWRQKACAGMKNTFAVSSVTCPYGFSNMWWRVDNPAAVLALRVFMRISVKPAERLLVGQESCRLVKESMNLLQIITPSRLVLPIKEWIWHVLASEACAQSLRPFPFFRSINLPEDCLSVTQRLLGTTWL